MSVITCPWCAHTGAPSGGDNPLCVKCSKCGAIRWDMPHRKGWDSVLHTFSCGHQVELHSHKVAEVCPTCGVRKAVVGRAYSLIPYVAKEKP